MRADETRKDWKGRCFNEQQLPSPGTYSPQERRGHSWGVAAGVWEWEWEWGGAWACGLAVVGVWVSGSERWNNGR